MLNEQVRASVTRYFIYDIAGSISFDVDANNSSSLNQARKSWRQEIKTSAGQDNRKMGWHTPVHQAYLSRRLSLEIVTKCFKKQCIM